MRLWARGISLLLATTGALAFIVLFGNFLIKVDAFQFQLRLLPSWHGVTEIDLPPVGSLRATTHATPLKIKISLNSINLDKVKELLQKAGAEKYLAGEARLVVKHKIYDIAWRLLALAIAGGFFGVLLARGRTVSQYLSGIVVGVLVVGVLMWGTYYSFRISGFQHVEYEGLLKAAPWVIGVAQDALGKVDSLGKQMQGVARNLYQVFGSIDRMDTMSGGQNGVRMLHVSDIHNNPAALSFISEIVRVFKVDLVIDTGDLTDLGTPLEVGITDRVAALKVPYFFVPGNHDTPEIVKALKAVANVTVLDNREVTFKGLKIRGFTDPALGTGNINWPLADLPIHVERLQKFVAEDPDIDVLAVHNHRLAAAAAGKIPLILYGHDHRLAIKKRGLSWVIDAGTTGGSGIWGLLALELAVPYSVILINYHSEGERLVPVTADSIRVSKLGEGFNLERQLLSRPATRGKPAMTVLNVR